VIAIGFLALMGWTLVILQTWNLRRALKFGIIRSKGDHIREDDSTDYWMAFGFTVFSWLFGAGLALVSTLVLLDAAFASAQ
jgi:hypothetical protein